MKAMLVQDCYGRKDGRQAGREEERSSFFESFSVTELGINLNLLKEI